MRVPNLSGFNRLSKTHKLSVAGLAATGAAAVAFAVVPGSAEAESGAQALNAKPASVAWNAEAFGSKVQQNGITTQANAVAKKAEDDAKKKAAEAMAQAKVKYAAEQKRKAAAEKLAKERAAKAAANRSKARTAPAQKTYANNLDGWIREALDIMHAKGIPGTYDGIHRNIIRESGGNPQAINNWDVNAQNGIPSKGLLQVIKPTFDAYHVDGTAWDQYDPVANITAACNYAADRYGSIDNVNSAY